MGIPPRKDGKSVESPVTLSLFNTNTQKRINATFPLRLNEANLKSSFSLDGVSGTGAKIIMDYLEPGGARTGKLLPTGNKTDLISLPTTPSNGIEEITVTLLDCTNPTVYTRFCDLDLEPTAAADGLDGPTLTKLENIRRAGATLMGLDPEMQSQPKIAVVAPPMDYTLSSGEKQDAGNVDLFIRALSMGQPHKAVPMTVAMATAVAARLEGTVVSDVARNRDHMVEDGVRIGHPSGTVVVGADITSEGHVKAAKVFRTARILMKGEVYW